jgi:hypothetical protein
VRDAYAVRVDARELRESAATGGDRRATRDSSGDAAERILGILQTTNEGEKK